MRKLLVKILFRLLAKEDHETFAGIKDKMIHDWLVRQYSDIGFREYFRKRTLQQLKSFGSGLNEENYKLLTGQRLELMLLLQKVDRSFKIEEKRLSKLKSKADKK